MAETQPEKKSKKKLIVIIALVLLLLGGGAGGYYFFFMHNTPAEGEHAGQADKATEEAHAEDAHKEEAKHEEAKHEEEVAEPDVYYNVPAPFLVNFPPGSSAKVIKISITLLMKGESGVAAIKKHEPMIKNNILMAISSIGVDKAKTTEGKRELKTLMLAEVGKALEKMAGKNTAKDLFFTEFVMQ